MQSGHSAMASKEPTFLEDFNEKFLVCPICSEQYKNAKVLPCQHSFCETCLLHVVEKIGKLDCPTCRRSCELPDGGVVNLQTNFFLNQMVEQFEKRDSAPPEITTCGSCDRSSVASHCLDCDVRLCEMCVKGHGKLRVTRSHRLMAIDEYEESKSENPAMVQPPLFCSKHDDNQIKFYCDTCESMICTDCTVIDHPVTTHKYRYLKEAADECKQSIQWMLRDLSKKEKEVERTTTAAEQVSESLERKLREEKAAIREYTQKKISEFKHMIEGKETLMLEQLQEIFDEKKHNVHAQLKEMEMVKNMKDFAEKLTHFGSDTQVITARKGMTTQIQELIDNLTNLEPAVDGCIKFIGIDQPAEVKSLGVVQTATCKVTLGKEFSRVGEEVEAALRIASKDVKSTVDANDLMAEIKTPDGKTEEVNITEIEEGRFVLRGKTKVAGIHELFVSVYNKPVDGSPININVIPQKGFRKTFCKGGSGKRQVNGPMGITITKKKDVLICDRYNKRLQLIKFNTTLTNISQCRNVNINMNPRLATISKNGNILISCFEKNEVFSYDENCQLLGCFGKDQMKGPSGIAVNSVDGRIYVADHDDNKIHIYSSDHKYIKSFGEEGSGKGNLLNPYGVCVTPDGNVVVSDSGNHRIQVFTADGEYIDGFGSRGSGDYQFNCPRGVATGKDGNLFVCDLFNGRVHKFDSQNQFLCYINDEGNKLAQPAGICIKDVEPFDVIIVTEFSGHCISILCQ
ncbi:tripartite motif-containing protein 2-like [Ptychodera flava]|uniref:tripartite motif-containing protein 2-like n=1 Tax=Ptychodera flava TaxID=63121 RepID=UPI003969CA52